MDIAKIKNLVKQNGDKFIFVENGEPEMVMMSFQEYEKLNGLSLQKRQIRLGSSGKDGPEFADFGLEEVPETEFMISNQSVGAAGLPVRTEDIRLEDLPI